MRLPAEARWPFAGYWRYNRRVTFRHWAKGHAAMWNRFWWRHADGRPLTLIERLGPKQGERAAFTLIELLVVIAILSLLLSLLTPSLVQAKALAQRAVCAANLKGLGNASLLYAGDNGGYVPRDAWYDPYDPRNPHGGISFAAKFSPYLGGPTFPFHDDDNYSYMHDRFKSVPIFHCPSVKDTEFTLTYVDNGLNFLRYSETRQWKGTGPVLVERQPIIPSETFYMIDANCLPGGLHPEEYGYYDVWHYRHWLWEGTGDPKPNEVRRCRAIHPSDTRHMGTCVVEFFDAHVEVRQMEPDQMTWYLFNPLMGRAY